MTDIAARAATLAKGKKLKNQLAALTATPYSATLCNTGHLPKEIYMPKKRRKQLALSPLENAVMQIVWNDQPLAAEDVREKMDKTHGLKASTVRTLLRRLEDKGYVAHEVEGRTYIYHAVVEQSNVAASAVRSIVDKFCAGSVEDLLVGLVDDKQISPERLKELANQIASAEAEQARTKRETKKSKK